MPLTTVLQKWEYLASYGDLINAFGPNPDKAADHYNHFVVGGTPGGSEVRPITFDAWGYLASYDDLMGAFGSDAVAAAKHYVTYGYSEHRATKTFDAQAYLNNYSDLQAVFGTNKVLAEQHYVVFGRAEQRNDYTLTATPSSSVNEGQTVVFTLDTHDLAQGTKFSYSISGDVNLADLDGSATSGVAEVGADHKALISIDLKADGLTEGSETLTLSIAGHAVSLEVNDTSVPTYALASVPATSVNEGATANFTLTTTNVPAGSTFAYVITGVDAADVVGGVLEGVATIGTDGKAEIGVTLAEDVLLEGAETLTLTFAGIIVGGVALKDTVVVQNTTAYSLTSSPELSVDETATVNFTLNTTGVPEGSAFDYAITGVDAADVVGGILVGTAIVGSDGKAVVSVTLAEDIDPESDETLTLTFGGIIVGGVALKDTVVVHNTTGNQEGIFHKLTPWKDVATAHTFDGNPEWSPGGDQFVNTLQDEDVLTGDGAGSKLDVELGDTNDSSEYMVSPVLNNIETVNLQISGDDIEGMNFQDTTDLRILNIDRITANNSSVIMQDLQDSTDALSLSNATRNGEVEFNYAEGVLEGVQDVVTLDLDNVRINELSVTQGAGTTDTEEDEGYNVELLDVTVSGTRSTNIDHFVLGANQQEEDEFGTVQELSFVANDDLEINHLLANGIETLTLEAWANIVFAADEHDALSESNSAFADIWGFMGATLEPLPKPEPVVLQYNGTADLQLVSIIGDHNVIIDGLDTEKDYVTLTVEAGELTGDLDLGVIHSSDSHLSWNSVASRNDEDIKVTSGSGDDTIYLYNNLAGDITTGEGNDVVSVFREVVPADSFTIYGDIEGVSQISTGSGDDSVTASDLLVTITDYDEHANENYDDLTAASIDTGSGNDTVTVETLHSDEDWDNNILDDHNNDDTYAHVGARIDTADGDDAVRVDNLEENAVVDTGADNDTFDVDLHSDAVILAEDTENWREETLDGTEQDVYGAQVFLGADDDIATFDDIEAIGEDIQDLGGSNTLYYTLLGNDAELHGNDGHDILNVKALDDVRIAADSNADGNAVSHSVMIFGIEEANLTVKNQIDAATAAITGETENDDSESDGRIIADIHRFDADLETVNLISEEDVLLTDERTSPNNEDYEAGTATSFVLDNHRSVITTTLTANEATGVDANGDIEDDGNIYEVTSPRVPSHENQNLSDIIKTNPVYYAAPSVIGNDSEWIDVYLHVNMDDADASEANDTFALYVQNSGEFDLDLTMAETHTRYGVGGADKDNLVENVTLNFDDTYSHYIDVNGFGEFDTVGDVWNTGHGEGYPTNSGDVTINVNTSLSINSAGAAGEILTVVRVNADTIIFQNADGVAPASAFTDVVDAVTGTINPIAADVRLQVDHSNNYKIATGSGDDIFDMRLDDVRPDDITTSTDRADYIYAGAGRDEMIVSGDDDLGNNDLANYPALTPDTLNDDDVFENLYSIEIVTVDTGIEMLKEAQNGDGTSLTDPQKITLDEAAGAKPGESKTHVDTLNIIGSNDHWLDLVIGNNFLVNNTDAEVDFLTIDADDHTGQLTLQIDNRDRDQDVDHVDLEVFTNSANGTQLNFVETGDEDSRLDVWVRESNFDGQNRVSATEGGVGEGVTDIDVQTHGLIDGSIDKITMVNGEGEYATRFGNTYTIADEWTSDGRGVEDIFTFDASDIQDTDSNSDTGGATFSVEFGDTADLTILGTQNDDFIRGGSYDDAISGNDGDDVIWGDDIEAYVDVLTLTPTVLRVGDIINFTYAGVLYGHSVTVSDTSVSGNLTIISNAFNASLNPALGDSVASVSGNQLIMTQTRAEHDVTDREYTTFSVTPASPVVEVKTYNTLGTLAIGESLSLVFGSATYTHVYSTDGAVNTWLAGIVELNGSSETFAAGVLTINGPSNGSAATLPDSVTITGGDGGTVFGPNTIATGQTATDFTGSTYANDDHIFSPAWDPTTGSGYIVGDGDDSIDGGDGYDTIYGAGGDDIINGDSGDDMLIGNWGDDTISGGTGDDVIAGLLGADTLTGGGNDDRFYYNVTIDSSGLEVDHVTDFVAGSGNDLFDFSRIVAEAGYANGNGLFVGTFATLGIADTALNLSATHLQVVYVTDTEMLYADNNGNGNIDTGELAIHVTDLVGTLVQANFDFTI